MKKELENKLIEDFPQLFQDIDKSMYESCMYWGVAVGDGWYDIIRKLCEDIMSIPDLPEDICFDQIKEKWGSLRIYMSSYIDEIEDLISAAENESGKTCEYCGSTSGVSPRRGGWIKILCDNCTTAAKV